MRPTGCWSASASSRPSLIQNVRTQVRDLDFDRPPCLDASVTMDRAWQLMREQKISAIPVVNEDGTLYGMLSAGDIATFSLNTIGDPRVEAMPLFNLLSVIEGRVMGDGGDLVDTVTGCRVHRPAPELRESAVRQRRQHRAVRQPAGYDPPGAGQAGVLPDPVPDGCGSRVAGKRRQDLHHLHPAATPAASTG